jgi:hypothetical protein
MSALTSWESTASKHPARGACSVIRADHNMSVRSLSPAYWFIYSKIKAAAEKGRGQVGPAYGTHGEALAALNALAGSAA